MILLCPYFQNGAKVADLTDCSKVYHKVMSSSQTKGCPFHLIDLLFKHCGTYEQLSWGQRCVYISIAGYTIG